VIADIVLFFPDPPGYHTQGKGSQGIAKGAAGDTAVGNGGYTHPVCPEILQHNLAIFATGPAQKIHQEGGGIHNVHVFIKIPKKPNVKRCNKNFSSIIKIRIYYHVFLIRNSYYHPAAA
jgi:hypothetical protein